MSNVNCFRSSVKPATQLHAGALTRNLLEIYGKSTTKVRQNYVSGSALNRTGSHSCSPAAAELLQIYYRFTAELQQESAFLNRRIGSRAENIRDPRGCAGSGSFDRFLERT